ncbi:MAG: hypothetical protein ABEK12_01205 [Candidatus Nanohaloarchaea archaeon]
MKFEEQEELTTFVQEKLVGSDMVEKTITHMAMDILAEGQDPEL